MGLFEEREVRAIYRSGSHGLLCGDRGNFTVFPDLQRRLGPCFFHDLITYPAPYFYGDDTGLSVAANPKAYPPVYVGHDTKSEAEKQERCPVFIYNIHRLESAGCLYPAVSTAGHGNSPGI